MTDTTDENMMAEHVSNVEKVARAVTGLTEKFAPVGMTPVAVFEGALKGGVMALLASCRVSPEEIAMLLEDAADNVRWINNAEKHH